MKDEVKKAKAFDRILDGLSNELARFANLQTRAHNAATAICHTPHPTEIQEKGDLPEPATVVEKLENKIGFLRRLNNSLADTVDTLEEAV